MLQVLRLLELMGLKGYEDAFMAERVNGEVLLECDDDVLLNELKVGPADFTMLAYIIKP